MSVTLGIDPSSTQVKKIYVNTASKNFPVLKSAKADKIIAVVPSNYLTFRKFQIPLRDRKKINEIIKEDLSQTLLIYDNAIWDFTFGPDGEIFAAITNKDTITKLIKQIGVKPHIFDAEPYALVRTASVCGHNEGLIIDFSDVKTTFAGFKNGLLNFCRVLLKSGNNLINELALKNNLNEKDALSLIQKNGLKDLNVLNFFKTMFEAAFPPQSLPKYSKVLMCGEFCDIPYLKDFIKELFNLPVEKLELEAKIKDSKYAVAFGAAIKNAVREHAAHEHGVNLATYKTESASFKKWLIWLLIPFVLLLINVKYKEIALSARVSKINKEMVSLLKKDFPDVKNTAYPLSQYKSLTQKYGTGQYPNGENILDILSKISASETAAVKIDSIEVSEQNIFIGGKSNSIKSVENLKQNLSQNFKNVDLSEIKNLKNEVKFTIKMDI